MITKKSARLARVRRRRKLQATIRGTEQRMRLCVFRSSAHIYAQIINDEQGHTLAAASSLDAEIRTRTPESEENHKVFLATEVGKLLAQRARERGITRVVYDRAGYLYHGRVKALADGARAGGLEF